MDTYPPSVFESHIENVHNAHHVLEGRTSHIFPAFAETMDTVLIEVFRHVAETYIWNYPISTVRVLLITITTSPGSCRFKTALMFFSLNLAYRLNSFISRYEGRCIARMLSVIQFELSP
jgi:hypothetical protein